MRGFAKFDHTWLEGFIPQLPAREGIILYLESRASLNQQHDFGRLLTATKKSPRTLERAIEAMTTQKELHQKNGYYYLGSSADKVSDRVSDKVAPHTPTNLATNTATNTPTSLSETAQENTVSDNKSMAPKKLKEGKEGKEVEETVSSTVFSSSLMPVWKLWIVASKLSGISLEQNQKDWNRWAELGLEIELQNHALEILKAGSYEFPVLALLKRMKGTEAVQQAKSEQQKTRESTSRAVLEGQNIIIGSRWEHPGSKKPLEVIEINNGTVFFAEGGPIGETWLSHMAGWKPLEQIPKDSPGTAFPKDRGVA